MKKLLAILLTLILICSLTSCAGSTQGASQASQGSQAGGAANQAAPADSTAGGGEVTVFGWGIGPEMDSHKKKVELFNAANTSGIKASIECVPNADYTTKLNAMLTAGNAPDVIMESADFNGFYYRNGNFENLTPFLERDGIVLEDILLPGIDSGNVHDGNYREAMPFSGNAMVMAYNKDLFDKMGVAYPTDDWTWNDFLEINRKLTVGDGAQKQFGICDHWGVKTIAPYAGGGKLYDLSVNPAVMKAGDAATIRGIEMYVDLMRNGLMPNSTATQEMPSEQRFFAGLGGMIFFFTWDASTFSQSIGDAFKWDVVQMPKNDNGDRVTLSWTTGYAMNKASSNKDGAWEFLKYVCLSEEANQQNSAVGMPVLQSMIADYSAQKIEGTDISFGTFMDAMAFGKINPLGGSFSELADEYTRYWDKMVIENADIAATMTELQSTGQPILDKLTASAK